MTPEALAQMRLQAILDSMGSQNEGAFNAQVERDSAAAKAEEQLRQEQLKMIQDEMIRQQEAQIFALKQQHDAQISAASRYQDPEKLMQAVTINPSDPFGLRTQPGGVDYTGPTTSTTTVPTTNSTYDPSDPYGIKTLIASQNQTTPSTTTPTTTAAGVNPLWKGVFGINTMPGGADYNSQYPGTSTTATTTTPQTTVTTPANTSITGNDDPYGIKALLSNTTNATTTTGKSTPLQNSSMPQTDTTGSTSISGSDDPYGIKALLEKQKLGNNVGNPYKSPYEGSMSMFTPANTSSASFMGGGSSSGLGSMIKGY